MEIFCIYPIIINTWTDTVFKHITWQHDTFRPRYVIQVSNQHLYSDSFTSKDKAPGPLDRKLNGPHSQYGHSGGKD
jgi:hypothetical protein